MFRRSRVNVDLGNVDFGNVVPFRISRVAHYLVAESRTVVQEMKSTKRAIDLKLLFDFVDAQSRHRAALGSQRRRMRRGGGDPRRLRRPLFGGPGPAPPSPGRTNPGSGRGRAPSTPRRLRPSQPHEPRWVARATGTRTPQIPEGWPDPPRSASSPGRGSHCPGCVPARISAPNATWRKRPNGLLVHRPQGRARRPASIRPPPPYRLEPRALRLARVPWAQVP